MSLNKCNHPQCKALKPHEMYACRKHWWQLPQHIRERLSIGWKKDPSMWTKAHSEAQDFWKNRRPDWAPAAPDVHQNKYGLRDGTHFIRCHRAQPLNRPSELTIVVVKGVLMVEDKIDLLQCESLCDLVGKARDMKKRLNSEIKK